MKKILVLALCLISLFALCACGEQENAGNDTNGASSIVADANNGNDTDKDTSTKKEGKDAFLGSWTHARTDAEPFQMNLTLNADGTGKNSNTDIEWTYDEATNQISITIIYPDGTKSDASPAKLTDAGTISWEREFNIKTTDGEFVKFDSATFVKQ